MAKSKPPKKPTALIRRPTSTLAPPLEAAPPTPYEKFVRSCTSERTRETMVARLRVAARILIGCACPCCTRDALPAEASDEHRHAAERFMWQGLDQNAVEQVLAAVRARKIEGEEPSPASVNLTRAALRKMAKVLFSMRLLDVEERQRIEDIPPDEGRRLKRRGFTARELRKLFAACANDETAAGRRDAALLAVLFGGGLRRDEASQIDLADLHVDQKLHIRGKGNREREQPLGNDAWAAVQVWVRARGEEAGPLFRPVDRFGRIVEQRRLTGKAIARAVRRRAKEASIEGKGVSPHALRRAFGTGLLLAGEDLATTSKALGHASVTTTARCYDTRDGAAVERAVAKLVVPFGG